MFLLPIMTVQLNNIVANQNGIIFALTDSDTMNTAIDASGKKTTMIQGKREKQMFNYTNCMDR